MNDSLFSWTDTVAKYFQTIDWTATLLNSAQVLSAVATAASVWVSLWLARRSESQRLKFYIDERRVITVGQEPRTATDAIATHLKLTVVNAGVLPAHIQMVFFDAQAGSTTRWVAALDPDNRAAFPATLAHGELMSLTMPLYAAKFPTGSKFRWWWWSLRVHFDVRTSLGVVKVRLKRKDIQWMRRAVMRARQLDSMTED